jgi:hypothetical protein
MVICLSLVVLLPAVSAGDEAQVRSKKIMKIDLCVEQKLENWYFNNCLLCASFACFGRFLKLMSQAVMTSCTWLSYADMHVCLLVFLEAS